MAAIVFQRGHISVQRWLTASFGFVALAYVAGASLILSLRIRDPLQASQGWKSD
jgi:hypothetical protein